MKRKRLINDPQNPQLFSNEELGLPDADYEYRWVEKTDEHGQKIRQRIVMRTKDYFVRAAQEIWGDQYDYSETVLINMKAPVTIRCKKHNHYFTVPFAQNHVIKAHGNVKPTGCDLCMNEQLGYKLPHGPRHFRTPEEIRQAEEEKARRKAERQQRAAENSAEAKRKQREQENQALIARYQAKNLSEARFMQKVHEMYGDDYDTSLIDYRDKETEVMLICKHHGCFLIKPRYLFNGYNGNPPHGCWKCSGLPDPHEKYTMTAKHFYKILSRKYANIIFERKRKIKRDTKIKGTCTRHGEIEHTAEWWLSGNGCEYCHGKFYPPQWKENARKVHGDKYEYVGEAPRTMSDTIHYICKEHGLQEQRYDVHVSLGCGCRECANYPNAKTPLQRCQEWIEKSDRKYRGEFNYSRAHETYVNNDSKVQLQHNTCGTWFEVTPDTHLRGVNGGCPVCNASYLESEGERTIRLWLEDHDIKHEAQHRLPNEDPTLPLQYLVADFYLPKVHDREMIIEFNGQQHYEDIPFFHEGKTIRTFAVQQHRDRYLRKYCNDYNIALLEIGYWDFERIDEILTEQLLE